MWMIRVRKGFEYSVEHPQTKMQEKTLQEEGPIQSKKQMQRGRSNVERGELVITNTSLTPNYVWGIALQPPIKKMRHQGRW